MNWQTISKNWKTSLAGAASFSMGILTFLLSVPAFMAAAQEWSAHQPVDWRGVFLNVVLAMAATGGGVGLLAAKDGDRHSTIAEVQTASQASKVPPALVGGVQH